MYADRHARPEGIKPGSLTVAIAINAGVVAALVLSSPDLVKRIVDPPLVTTNVPVDPVPDPIPPETKAQPQQRRQATSRIDHPDPMVKSIGTGFVLPPLPPLPPFEPGSGAGTAIADPPLPPVLTDAAIDPRYARDFQPDYPAGERRMENEGKVVIRVLVGTDGRVRQVERVSAASDGFWRATERQALTRWRFRPATRDGVPIEAWRTMTVRFEMAEN